MRVVRGEGRGGGGKRQEIATGRWGSGGGVNGPFWFSGARRFVSLGSDETHVSAVVVTVVRRPRCQPDGLGCRYLTCLEAAGAHTHLALTHTLPKLPKCVTGIEP